MLEQADVARWLPAVACFKEKFFPKDEAGIYGMVPSRPDQSDDIASDRPVLHHQVFNECFRCKRVNVVSTDRHPSASQLAQFG